MTAILSLTDDLKTVDVDTLKLALEALERLEATEGRKAKEEILAGARDNLVFQFFLKAAMCGDVYFITLEKDIKSANERLSHLEAFHTFSRMLIALRDRKVTGNAAIEKSRKFLSRCHPRLRTWMVRTLHRDLRCGIGRRTVEKTFGKEFWVDPESLKRGWYYHGSLAAKSYGKVYEKKSPEFPLAAEVKLDGERACEFYIGKDDHTYVLSRGNKRKTEIEGVAAYQKQLRDFSQNLARVSGLDPSFYLDGEFLSSDWNQTASVVSRRVNFSEQNFLEKVRVILWDWAPVPDYMAGKFSLPWQKRKALLLQAAGLTRPTHKPTRVSQNVYVLGHHIVRNMDQLEELYTWSLDAGFEGLMLKQLDGPHVFHRRHTYVVKMKAEADVTGTVVEVLPGDGQNDVAPVLTISDVEDYLRSCGNVEDDGYYIHCAIKNEKDREKVVDGLKEIVHDGVERRISTHIPGYVSYRYSERTGKLVVEHKGQRFHVGSGIPHKAGNDLRMEFWQRRDELIGMKVDFRIQKATGTENILMRNNRFLRLRRDLS
jgi:ATP-dependent DNA ligase